MPTAAVALLIGLGVCSGMSRQEQNTAIDAGVGAVGGGVIGHEVNKPKQ